MRLAASHYAQRRSSQIKFLVRCHRQKLASIQRWRFNIGDE
jgi:hypothetical protein